MYVLGEENPTKVRVILAKRGKKVQREQSGNEMREFPGEERWRTAARLMITGLGSSLLGKYLEILWIKKTAPISLFGSQQDIMLNTVDGTSGQCPVACKESIILVAPERGICVLISSFRSCKRAYLSLAPIRKTSLLTERDPSLIKAFTKLSRNV